MKNYVVIPTRVSRPLELDQSIESVKADADCVILVDNSPTGLLGANWSDTVHVMRVTQPEPNISYWWNVGLEYASGLARDAGKEQWNVLVMNDDVLAGPDLIPMLGFYLRTKTTAQLSFPDVDGLYSGPRYYTQVPPNDHLHERMTGYCFMLRGENELRFDERFHWWYGDDDMDWRARKAGGTVCVPRVQLQHLHPDESTSASASLTRRAGVDRSEFIAKWGRAPW